MVRMYVGNRCLGFRKPRQFFIRVHAGQQCRGFSFLSTHSEGCWWKYVLKKPHTSNKMLHELAREVRGVEIKRSKPLKLTQYKTIYSKWEEPSRRFLRKGHDYFTEFLAKLSIVTMPKGETLESAFERAKLRKPPPKVWDAPSNGLRLLATLCAELQEMFRERPIMLHQASIAKLFGVSQQTISQWNCALKTLRVLTLAERASPNVRAARYFFTE
jgi:hypothetical protein